MMKIWKWAMILMLAGYLAGCGARTDDDAVHDGIEAGEAGSGPAVGNENTASEENAAASKGLSSRSPYRTIREHFMALPEKYFYAESCDKAKDKDCQAAKRDYLKTFLEVEDTKNGYLKAGCDGAQSCIEMTIFRKPDDSYLVAVVTEFEMGREQYFLEYQDGKWFESGDRVIPEYGKDKIYELPRQGTTMSVFEKKITEKGEDHEIAEKGKKLYDLVWKDGKFSKK